MELMEQRKVRKCVNGEWIDTELKDLKSGEHFMLNELTGEPVLGANGGFIFIASSDAFLKDGVWTINTRDYLL